MAERYVSALAGGGGTGTVGNPWTFAEMIAAINGGGVANGDRCNVKADGTYTVNDFVINRNAANNSSITIQGYTSTIGDGGKPTIQRQAGEAGTWWDFNGHYYVLADMILDGNSVGDGTGDLLQALASMHIVRLELKNANNTQALELGGAHGKAINCYIHDNPLVTVAANHGGYWNCRIIDNGGSSLLNAFWANNCIIKTGTKSVSLYVVQNSYLTNSIVDVNGEDMSGMLITSYVYGAINTVFMNADQAGRYGALSTQTMFLVNCNFTNCDTDHSGPTRFVENITNLAPQFSNPAGGDYTRTGSNLADIGIGVGMAAENYGIDLGVDQRRTCTLPATAQVEKGIGYVDHGVVKTGTLEAVSLILPMDVVVEDEQLVVEVSGDGLEVEVNV